MEPVPPPPLPPGATAPPPPTPDLPREPDPDATVVLAPTPGPAAPVPPGSEPADALVPQTGGVPPVRAALGVPAWAYGLLIVVLAVTVGVGLVGLVAAVGGAFAPVPVLVVGGALGAVVGLVAAPGVWTQWRAEQAGAGDEAGTDAPDGGPPVSDLLRRMAPHVAALTALAVAALSAGWNASQHGEHLLTDRDPAVYAVTGRQILDTGSLAAPLPPGPFADDPAVDRAAPGGFAVDGEALSPQFTHLWPVLVAVADGLGGTGWALRLPALFGGVALFAFWVLVARWAGPWPAVGATATLALVLPQVWLSRDMFTEVPQQAFTFGALALVALAFDTRTPGPAFVGGVVVGAACGLRIDGLAVVAVLAAWAGGEWAAAEWRASRGERDRLQGLGARLAFLGAGVFAGVAVTFTDLLTRSAPYVGQHRPEITALAVLVVLGAAGGLALAALAPALGPLWRLLGRWRTALGAAAAVLLVLAVAFGWFVRPSIETTTEIDDTTDVGALQQGLGLPVEPERRYYEDSVVWLSWYLGPVGLAAGTVGVALATSRLVGNRPARRGAPGGPDDRSRGVLVLALVVVAVPSLVYLWRARAVPDHLWVMRRFAPLTMPALVAGSWGLVGGLTGLAWRGWGRRTTAPAASPGRAGTAGADGAGPGAARRPMPVGLRVAAGAGAAAVGVLAVAGPASALSPVAGLRPQQGVRSTVSQACDRLGAGTAVLVLGSEAADILPATLATFCGVPAAGARPWLTRAEVEELRAAWAAEGRTLWVASTRADELAGLTPTLVDLGTDNPYELERTLDRPPSRLFTYRWPIVLGPVTVPDDDPFDGVSSGG